MTWVSAETAVRSAVTSEKVAVSARSRPVRDGHHGVAVSKSLDKSRASWNDVPGGDDFFERGSSCRPEPKSLHKGTFIVLLKSRTNRQYVLLWLHSHRQPICGEIIDFHAMRVCLNKLKYFDVCLRSNIEEF